MTSQDWYEVWADEGHDVPALLLLRPTASGFEVLDPGQGYLRVFAAAEYDQARFWLNEDEFVLVARKTLDDF
jgi:hypothetical protein